VEFATSYNNSDYLDTACFTISLGIIDNLKLRVVEGGVETNEVGTENDSKSRN
jgi:hypothetical protein